MMVCLPIVCSEAGLIGLKESTNKTGIIKQECSEKQLPRLVQQAALLPESENNGQHCSLLISPLRAFFSTLCIKAAVTLWEVKRYKKREKEISGDVSFPHSSTSK